MAAMPRQLNWPQAIGRRGKKLRLVAQMPRSERRRFLRRKIDYYKGSVLFGRLGPLLNGCTRFGYLSYLPDAIREYDAIPHFSKSARSWMRGNARVNAGDLSRLVFLLLNASRVSTLR